MKDTRKQSGWGWDFPGFDRMQGFTIRAKAILVLRFVIVTLLFCVPFSVLVNGIKYGDWSFDWGVFLGLLIAWMLVLIVMPLLERIIKF